MRFIAIEQHLSPADVLIGESPLPQQRGQESSKMSEGAPIRHLGGEKIAHGSADRLLRIPPATASA